MSSLPEPSKAEGTPDLAVFIGESLEAVRRECPAAYVRLCGLLAPRSIRVVVDGEVAGLAVSWIGIAVLPGPGPASVTVETSRRAILDLVDDRLTVAQAVDAGAVAVSGTLADLAVLHEGLRVYVQGAVRSPSLPGILERFRRSRPDDWRRDSVS